MTDINQLQLSIEETVGQVVMPRIDFNESGHIRESIRLVEEYNVTGFIIFNGELEEAKDLINKLQSISKYPLFFGCDAERGLGQIVKGGTKFPFLMAQGAANNIDLLKEQAKLTATEMRYCGFNTLFAPVLDINSNPNNPIINIRSFSDNPDTVTKLANTFINTVKENGVFTCGKHFPGHGSTDIDSHVDMPELNKKLDELEILEFIPFKKAIESGVDFIMVGHIAIPEIEKDFKPAIMSKNLIQDILKKNLKFEKIVITDSFRMDALNSFGAEFETAIKSLEAGCNIILDPKNPYELIDKIKLEINHNEMLLSKIKESSNNVLNLKEELVNNKLPEKPDKIFKNRLIQRISAESVCVVKNGNIDSTKVDINILDVTEGERQLVRPFTECLEGNGIIVNSVNYISENNLQVYSSPFNIINLIVTSVAAWTDHSHINSKLKLFLEKISNSGSKNILVSFGAPYVIKDLHQFDAIFCSFDSLPECQIAVAKNLLGKCSSEAKLPVRI
ncbi:MAG: glycoside hydrolase family 3 N-terminal domain-containing protein [Thermodesulfobacteriota bacterium]